MSAAVKRILIVEDDASITRVLRDNLVFEGFDVQAAGSGEEALSCASAFAPDLVLLDIMLPGIDGFQVCRALGETPTRTPIIILTARTQKDDKVHGLELGADDYVTKPFALDELLARIHAVLRRARPAQQRLVVGDLVVDFSQMRGWRGDRELVLTHKELELLQYLAERAGRIVSRDELLRLVWRYAEVPITRTVDNFIARLRRKIELDPRHPRLIRTVHGDGYSLTLQP
jgi:DNA-binding response OmpR family regulator